MSGPYTVKQVAEILGYSTNSIYSFIKEGRINGVRVGMGRFRITEEELNRVLHLSKKSNIMATPEKTLPIEMNIHFDIASLFSWFLGIGSIVLGAALFLFHRYSGKLAAEGYSDWINMIRISFIAAGAGLLLSDLIAHKTSAPWYKLFRAVLLILYTGYTYISFRIGDGGGGILYGIISLILLLHLFKVLKGMGSFLLFVVLFVISLPLTLFFLPDYIGLSSIFHINEDNRILILFITFFVFVTLGVLLIWSHYRRRVLFWVLMNIYGFLLIFLALRFADSLIWGKAFFVLLMGLTSLLVPVWESLHLVGKLERRTILPFFGLILLFLLLLSGLIGVIEQNIIEYAKKELQSKAANGNTFISSTLRSIEQTITGTANDEGFQEALVKGGNDEVLRFIRVVYESKRYLRNLVVFDEKGSFLSVYPYSTVHDTNPLYRNFFLKAKETGRLFVSELFESDPVRRENIIVMSTPVKDRSGKFIGVLVANVDLDWISIRLQNIANLDNGEFFLIANASSRIISHPDRNLIGEKINQNDYDSKGERILSSSLKVNEYDWLLQIQASLIKVLSPTRALSIGFFIFVGILVVILGTFVVFLRNISSMKM